MARRIHCVVLVACWQVYTCCACFVASSCRTENSAGEVTVCGGTDLKSSQHYPPLFGRSVAELMVAREAWVVLFQPMATLPLCVAVFWKDEVRNEVEKRRTGLRYRVANENIWACCARQKLLESKTRREMKDLGAGWAGWDGYWPGLPWQVSSGCSGYIQGSLKTTLFNHHRAECCVVLGLLWVSLSLKRLGFYGGFFLDMKPSGSTCLIIKVLRVLLFRGVVWVSLSLKRL